MIRDFIKYYDRDLALDLRMNRSYLLGSALLFLLMRVAGDILFLLTRFIEGDTIIIWKVITSAAVFGALALYIFSEKRLAETTRDPIKNYLNEYIIITLLLIGVLVFNAVLPAKSPDTWKPGDIFNLLLSEMATVYTVVVAILFLRFTYKWLMARRHKKTRLYLKSLAVLILALPFMGIAGEIFGLHDYTIYTTIEVFIYFAGAVLIAIAARKNTWIALIARNHKVRLLWISLLAMVICLAVLLTVGDGKSDLYFAVDHFMPGLEAFIDAAALICGVYSLRIFFATVAALPTSEIVERRTSEISSLTYLNRYIAASIKSDNSYLIDTVTKLALQSSGAVAAWTELYEPDGGETLCCPTPNVSEERLRRAKENINIQKRLRELRKTLLIESIPENEEFSFLQREMPFANSMIIVPLFSGDTKIGNLFVVHNDEFGFEQDDVKVLSAFSDNVSIALENSRLVKESIEKEHYKRELMLAREMQKKLLPQELPHMENFSLGAFSLPAEEVGGDYYEICRLKGGDICMLIGDVSGKGMTAAFYMAQLKGVALSHAPECGDPAELLRRINATMYGSMEKQMFITLSAITIDESNCRIMMARAGHMPAIIRKNGLIEIVRPDGIGIGLAPAEVFDKSMELYQSEFEFGDSCLLFTDGVNELRNEKGHDFGYEPLEKIVGRSGYDTAEELIKIIIDNLQNFSGSNPAHDDMTVIAVLCNNNQDSGK